MTTKPARISPDSFLRGALILLLIWLPLPMGSVPHWASSFFVAAIALLTCVWALINLKKRRPRNDASPAEDSALHDIRRAALPLLTMLVLVQFWVFLQWLLGTTTDSGETFRHLLIGAAYCLLFWLTVNLFVRRSHLTLLLTALIVSGIFQAFFGAFMTLSGLEWLLFGPKEHYREVVTGTFVNRNHMAGYLEMIIPCAIGMMLALRTGRSFNWRNVLDVLLSSKMHLRISLVIMVIALVMTQSRMGNTAFFSSLLIIGAIFVMTSKKHRLRNGLILASLIAIDLLVISQYFGLERLKDRLVNTRVEDVVVEGQVVAHRNEARLEVFDYAWEQYRERPIQGFGAGSFKTSFAKYPGHDILADFDHAHNDYLQFAIEFGLIGILPLAFFVILAFCLALKALLRRESFYRSGVGFAASMGILSLMIHSATDFNLQIPANAATFVVLCAVAVLANHALAPYGTRRRTTT